MNSRQFVACKFRDTDTRAYTYHWDGEPLVAGDVVRVEDRSGDGWKRVIVASVSGMAPPFPTKPILGRHVDDADGAAMADLPPRGPAPTPADLASPMPF